MGSIKCLNEDFLGRNYKAQDNDIYRKFKKQFLYLANPQLSSPETFVDYPNNQYCDDIEIFHSNIASDIKFLIGFAGVGKTTLLKHHFDYDTMTIYKNDVKGEIVIPSTWNGVRFPEKNYMDKIDSKIITTIYNTIKCLYKDYHLFLKKESINICEFVRSIRQDLLAVVTLAEAEDKNEDQIAYDQLKKTQKESPFSFACMLLKYVIHHHSNKIKSIVLIVDDTETLAETRLEYIVNRYLEMWACLNNNADKYIVKLLISLRPHSFRYIEESLYKVPSPYFTNAGTHIILKNTIPNIKDIFKKRFEYAVKNTDSPGNPTTWLSSKEEFYDIIESILDSSIEIIADLCHMDIRSSMDCFQKVILNRTWCQEYSNDFRFPIVKQSDYRFNIVTVVRTLACGESPVYLGLNDSETELGEGQAHISFDGSKVFIPNLLCNLKDKSCDILAVLIMCYLEKDSRTNSITDKALSKKELKETLVKFFPMRTIDEIDHILNYLFENRIIRKSLYTSDGEDTMNILQDMDCIYFTQKGARLLKMLENDSVLLEIYREDIRREFSDECGETSLTLIRKNRRDVLFEDLIALANEIFINEDSYCFKYRNKESFFYNNKFVFTKKILSGIKYSLSKAYFKDDVNKKLSDDDIKKKLNKDIENLEKIINKRISEL